MFMIMPHSCGKVPVALPPLLAPDVSPRQYVPVSEVVLEPHVALTVWREGVDFPPLLVKQVFTTKDDSIGILYLVTSDTTLCQKEYHQSLKSNLAFAKSPTRTVRTQSNPIFACLLAFVKRERIRMKTPLSHFTMQTKLSQAAIASAFEQLQVLKPNCSLA